VAKISLLFTFNISFDTLTSKRKQKYAGLRTMFDLFRTNIGVEANKKNRKIESKKSQKNCNCTSREEKDKL
jgi:hypothetical protein